MDYFNEGGVENVTVWSESEANKSVGGGRSKRNRKVGGGRRRRYLLFLRFRRRRRDRRDRFGLRFGRKFFMGR